MGDEPVRRAPTYRGSAALSPEDSGHYEHRQDLNAMGSETLRRTVRINNPQGFHLRPLTAFVQAALRFESTVFVWKGEQRVDGKSPLELMLLAAEQGTELTLEVTGSDAGQAIEVLGEILAAESLPDPPEAAGAAK